MGEQDTRPVLRVIRGNPTDEELAALVSVLAARAQASQAAGADQRPRRSAWSDRGRMLRRPLPHGPGAWRASGLPR
jgi:hypothetical protein